MATKTSVAIQIEVRSRVAEAPLQQCNAELDGASERKVVARFELTRVMRSARRDEGLNGALVHHIRGVHHPFRPQAAFRLQIVTVDSASRLLIHSGGMSQETVASD